MSNQPASDASSPHPETDLLGTTSLTTGELDRAMAASSQSQRDLTPQRVGPYRILEALGAGGMGVVYKAEQRTPIRRTVAIKIIKLGFDTEEVIARFNSERQALARMDHPNIAKVLDAGAADNGRPYFAMEFVAGKPITRFCDDNRLSIRQRLELFCQVCSAIAHAHTKAIIHRDIKASNVLAYLHDGEPAVKVIDFGLAKALTGDRLTEQTFNTQMGRVIGTIDTMSPEQADGSPDIDTRTDVYSLGILLYELLSGAKPFDTETMANASYEEIRRIILEVEPPRPSMKLSALGDRASSIAVARHERIEGLAQSLRRELDWIPMKALRKERARRYVSPQQMSDDIRNFLQGRPLIAAPESRVYRVNKFIQRHRGPTIAVAAALLLGAGATGFYIRAIRSEQANTLREKLEADRQREEARRQEQRAIGQAAIADAINRFLTDMLASANPDRLRGHNVTVLHTVQAAIHELNAGKLKDQPSVEAGVRDAIGRTLTELGRYDDAASQLRRALELRRSIPGNGPVPVASSLNNLALVLQFQGKLSEAERLSREALAIVRGAYALGNTELVLFLNTLAGQLEAQRKLPEAELLAREALDICRKNLPVGDPGVVMSLNNLAAVLLDQARLAEAEPLYREALEIYRNSLPAGHPSIATSLINLASILMYQGKPAEAETLCREAVDIYRKRLPPGHTNLGSSLNNLAEVLKDQGKLLEAEPLYREALDIHRKALPVGHPAIGAIAGNLAKLLDERGKTAEAATVRNEYHLAGATTRPTSAPSTQSASAP